MPTRLPALFLLLTCLAATAASQDPAPERVHVANDAMRGLLIKRVAPNYPPLARQARIQGTVMLNAVINKSGDVEDLQLISGHPMLAPAAIEAVKQWKYQPYLLNGEPVAVDTRIQVNFALSGDPAGATPGGSPSNGIGAILTNVPAPGTDPAPTVPEAVMRALRIQEVDPDYPSQALQTNISGRVVLYVVINSFGNVERLAIISGHPLLAPAAIEAVKQWRYTPYLRNSESIRAQTTVTLDFVVSSDQGSEGRVSDGLLEAGAESTGLRGFVASTPPPGEHLPKRIRVSSGVSAGLILTRVNPEYPSDAREARIQGVVVLKVNVDEEGRVVRVELISGHPMLAPAAIEAVRQWTYRPYLLNGKPIEVETQVQVNFTLSGS
jgi:TonB family protein